MAAFLDISQSIAFKPQPEPSPNAAGATNEDSASASAVWANQPPEKMEAILNSGMAFIGGLLEMATGQRIETGAASEKMVRIDKETGEVTMKFKLPGF